MCVRTDFGLLCLASRESELDAAIGAAQELARLHNQGAEHTRVEVYALKGRVAETDDEAAKGIASEVRALLDGMSEGIAKADPAQIREAASRARKLGALLDDATSLKVSDAVSEAREAARVIVKRVVDGGESIEAVVKEIKTEAQETARFAFLDMDPVADIAEPETTPVAVDLGEVSEEEFVALATNARVKTRRGPKKAKPVELDMDEVK